MNIAMLGSDYRFGLMPVYAGREGYIRSSSYLGADTSGVNWLDEIKGLLDRGVGIASQALEAKKADAQARGAVAEAAKAESMLSSIRKGVNPFTGEKIGAMDIAPWAIGGAVAIVALVVLARSGRRR